MTITQQQLADILLVKPVTLRLWIDPLNKTFERFEINTVQRLSAFIANVGHESTNFTAVTENLNYDAKRLVEVFPTQIKNGDIAKFYAGKPVAIANRVYANRMGNGNEQSGDGWKYRGRGPIGLTGRDNYKELSVDEKIDCLAHPELIEIPEYGALSAGWFWNKRSLNQYCDKGEFVTVVKKINGGLNGLPERNIIYLRALKVLQ